MNGAGSPGQQRLDRQQVEVDVVAGEHDLLAGAAADGLRQRVGDRLQLPQAAHLVDEPLRRLHLEHVLELRRRRRRAARRRSARHMRRSVPNWLISSGCARALRALEQQRRAAGLDGAVDDLGDLEVRVDLGGDANELALALEQRDPVAQVAQAAATRGSV